MITIRRPTINDREGISSIFIEKEVGNFLTSLPPGMAMISKQLGIKNIEDEMLGMVDKSMFDSYLNDFLSPRNRCRLIERNDKIIGFCLASYDKSFLFNRFENIIGIGDIYIKKAYRNKRFGSILLKSFIKSMYKEGSCYIIIFLDEKTYNEEIERFLIKNGFEVEKISYKKSLSGNKYKVNHNIREATPEDYLGYMTLNNYMYESFLEFDKDLYNGAKVVYSEDFYLSELYRDDTHLFVYETNNEIAGICKILETKGEIEIHTVSVAKKYARQGIATSFYNFAFNYAMVNGYKSVEAVVFAKNTSSCKFHEHMNMKPAGFRYVYKKTKENATTEKPE